jgi:hypothetical protein
MDGQPSQTPAEPTLQTERVLLVYRELKSLLADDALPPGARANAQQALSAMWQVVNNLALDYEFPYDLGI